MKVLVLPYDMNKKEINEIRCILDRGIHDFLVKEFGLASKEDYLAFRDDLKVSLGMLADEQRTLKALIRRPGGCPDAQRAGAANARAVTLLVDIRQQARHWAICQARNKMEDDNPVHEVCVSF